MSIEREEETRNQILNYVFESNPKVSEIADCKIYGQRINRVTKLTAVTRSIPDLEVERDFRTFYPHSMKRLPDPPLNSQQSIEVRGIKVKKRPATKPKQPITVEKLTRGSTLEKHRKLFEEYTKVSKTNFPSKPRPLTTIIQTNCPFHEVDTIKLLIDNVHRKREPKPKEEEKPLPVPEKEPEENNNKINLKDIRAGFIKVTPPKPKETYYDDILVVEPSNRLGGRVVFRSDRLNEEKLKRYNNVLKIRQH